MMKDQFAEPTLTAAAVDKLVTACLYGTDRPADGALVIQGIVRSFGFDRERIAESTAAIEQLIDELPDEFLMSGGGGWTFLNLCQDRHGRQWTGLQPKMEAFCCLAIAAKRAAWLLPRDMWSALPGGVPYIAFQTGKALAEAEAA